MEAEKRVNCGSCRGACCQKGTVIELNADEAAHIRRARTFLLPYFEAKPDVDWAKIMAGKTSGNIRTQLMINQAAELQPGNGYYQFVSDCGYLDKQNGYTCSDYENRPRICRVFKPGSPDCLKVRKIKGVD